MNQLTVDDYPVGSVGIIDNTKPLDIFKKSEHEEVMDELKKVDGELAEIKRRVKDLQTYPPPYIPYPQVPCYWRCCRIICYGCPYVNNPYPSYIELAYYTEPYTAPYYYGTNPQWSILDTFTGGTACT